MRNEFTDKPLILIVDDDPVLVEVARSSIEEMDMRVISAADGESGLRAFADDRPDLILLDVSMPGMNGFEACAAIREQPFGQDVPVIIVTGLDDSGSMTRAFEVGATDFITKPLAPPVLQNRIRFTLRALKAFDELRESQRQLASAQAVARVGSWELDTESGAFTCSQELLRIFDVPPDEGLDTVEALIACFPRDDRDRLKRELSRFAASPQPGTGDEPRRTSEMTNEIVHVTLEFRQSPAEDHGTIFGTVQDIRERRKTEAEIRRLAYFDSLTALPNRRLFQEQLESAVARALVSGDSLALLFVDIDRFKRINETLGHSAGDELLKVVADRIIRLVRSHDGLGRPGKRELDGSIARLGGDEFTLFLHRVRKPDDAALVARRILAALGPPVRLGREEVTVSASVGIAIYPADAQVPESLLRHAESAMYHAKRNGGAGFQFFSNSMNEAAIRKLNLETGLRRVLESLSIGVHYQPIVDAKTLETTGLEALARLKVDGDTISPAEFIPVAEESGLIIALGEQVLRSSCQQMQRLGEAARGLRLAVNVSSWQLRYEGFAAQVGAILDETQFEAALLHLEITESAALDEEERVNHTLHELDRMGVRLALDDFGTGYASVSYLRKLPVRSLKIDRSFTRSVPEDRENATIVSAMIALASRLGLSVTVEGVETQSEADYVTAVGANELQGYHFSRPLAPELLADFLAERPSRRVQEDQTEPMPRPTPKAQPGRDRA